jgi:tetratricopeptide (TPR) repeat protein
MSFDPPDTLRQAFCQAASDLDAAEASGQPGAISQALAQVARCYRGIGALASAESGFEMALRWSRLTGAADGSVDLLCELAETAAGLAEQLSPGEDPGAVVAPQRAAARAARERARDHGFEAAALATRVADAGWEAHVLMRVGEVLRRCGDHDDAAAMHTRALRLAGGTLGRPDPAVLPGLGRLADG